MAKWIMLDASNNRYFVNSDKTIRSPMEIRSKLAYNDNIECNVPDDNYKMYMAKNMFYFKSPQINTFGSDLLTEQKTIYCIPCGFDVLEREIAYCQCAIKNTSEEFAQDLEKKLHRHIKKEHPLIVCLLNCLFRIVKTIFIRSNQKEFVAAFLQRSDIWLVIYYDRPIFLVFTAGLWVFDFRLQIEHENQK